MIEAINKCLEENTEAMVKSLQEAIAIRSVLGAPQPGAPYGAESRKALQYAMDLAKDMGFEKVVNVEDRVCYVEYGEGERVIGVFAHLDVVPEGDNWTYPPFGGEIHDHCIFGRGAVDNKGPYLSSLYALKAIKDCGLALNSRIRLVGGSNEESGCEDMKFYVRKCGAPDAGFTPDSIYPMSFTERGINYYHMSLKFARPSSSKAKVLSVGGGDILNMVPDKASAVIRVSDQKEYDRVMTLIHDHRSSTGCEISASGDGSIITIRSRGECAHSCTPANGKNAIVAVLLLLNELGVDGTPGEFLKFFAEKIGNTTDGSLMGMKRADHCGKLTFSLSKIQMDENGLTWVVNIRYPYTYMERVTPDFEAQMREIGMAVDRLDSQPSYCFSIDHPLIRTLRSVYEEFTGRDSTPCTEGGTYAKVVPNIVPFGSIYPDEPDLCHRPDEKIDIDELLLNSKIFAHAMLSLANHS